MGSSLNQRATEFSLCNTLVLLLDLAFKEPSQKSRTAICTKNARPSKTTFFAGVRPTVILHFHRRTDGGQ